ncbi:MAG: pyruvate ferredoxin oxidoreductase [Nitrospirae bacterium]|nr:pyruvate ferredoxin oxidoreductase [Nitrospirota bacterium]MBI3595281.1 pyruvate ferredoxin oxidoreductase [Nitrospirota bacterium]
MYVVAEIDESICSETSCRLCTQYCPEANTILYDTVRKTAFVAIDRCKGCEICVGICDTLAKHHAIKMVAADQVKHPFEMSKAGIPK